MTMLFGELALALTTVLAAASPGQTFDVVGWYVGDNFTDWPIESLRWDVYSTIRFGSVRVAADGTREVTRMGKRKLGDSWQMVDHVTRHVRKLVQGVDDPDDSD